MAQSYDCGSDGNQTTLTTMAIWHYYNESGEKVGPVRGRELIALVQQGTVTPETKIEDSDGRTALAKNVRGLTFPATVQSLSNTAENLDESDWSSAIITLREDIVRLQQEQQRISGTLTSAPAPPGANPFTGAIPAAPNPFSAPPPNKRQTKPPTDEKRESLLSTMVAAMRASMSFLASTLGFILVLVLAFVVAGVIWWLLETTDVIPTHFLDRFSEKQAAVLSR
jgi:hypothetical protein